MKTIKLHPTANPIVVVTREVLRRSDTLIDLATWLQINVSSPLRHSWLGAYTLPAWKRKSVRIPKKQPFLKDWLKANDLDPSILSDEVSLMFARWYAFTGQPLGGKVGIIVHPRCDVGQQTIATVGNKPFDGAMIYPLKVWPEGIERIPEWDANSNG